ncbi:MAG: GHKL domain-containing protein [Bacteroidetes bacterium]|nr:GHKL domain-containing protein [Bacteroidota bacterium]
MTKFFVACLFLLATMSSAQTGLPTGKIYEALKKQDVWSIAQDERGILYVLTDAGLYLYDGVEFTLVGETFPRNSIAIDSSGIYVGGLNEFDRLVSDETGKVHFESLLPLFKELGDSIKIGSAWRIHRTTKKVYCTTPRFILELDKLTKSTKVYTAGVDEAFYNGFIHNDTYYLSVRGRGLMYLKDNRLVLAPYGDDPATPFVKDGLYSTGLEWKNGQRLLGYGAALMQYNWGKTKPSPFRLKSNFLSKGNYTLYSSHTISKNRHVLATLEKGAILIDTMGHVLNYFTDSTGMPGNNLIHAFSDKNQNIWFGHYQNKSCLTKMEMGLDLSVWDERVGLKSGIFDILKYKGKIHISTTQAIYTIDKDGRVNDLLKKGVTFNFMTIFKTESDEKLLVSALSREIWDVSDGKANVIYSGEEYVSQIVQSKIFPDRLLVLFENSLGYLQMDHGKWIFHEIDHETGGLFVVEDGPNVIWVIGFREISRFELVNDHDAVKIKSVQRFTPKDGYPDEFSSPRMYQGKLLFVSMGKGIYCYNEITKRLEKWKGIGKRFESIVSNAASFEVNPIDNSIYFSTDITRPFNGRIYKNAAGDTVIDYNPFKRIPDLNFYPGYGYYFDDDGSLWMGGTKGLARYDPHNDTKNYDLDFKCVIRKITQGRDSLVFDGGLYEKELEKRTTRLLNNFGNLTIRYAAPFFDLEEQTKFSYRLEGRDTEWSPWSSQPFKEYSDLPEGSYVFFVKAKNVYDKESDAARFSFTVLPPWYRTWWAYASYTLLFIGLVLTLIRWRTQALSEREKELEALVARRTYELVTINHELESNRKVLKQNNDELTVTNENLIKAQKQLVESEKMASLGQLTAGIAHEINNPINFISGGVQALTQLQNDLLAGKTLTQEEKQTQEEINELIKSIKNGVTRTVNIIKSLRTISHSSPEINTSIPITEALDNALVLLHGKIVNQGVSLKKDFQHRSLVKANSPQLSQVFINLLDNAIYAVKNKNGERIITIATRETAKDLVITIEDNGCGIPDGAKSHVFEPFFTTKEVGSGTGLGMSICYSIINNHKGTITFESELDKGTVFTITLPKQ